MPQRPLHHLQPHKHVTNTTWTTCHSARSITYSHTITLQTLLGQHATAPAPSPTATQTRYKHYLDYMPQRALHHLQPHEHVTNTTWTTLFVTCLCGCRWWSGRCGMLSNSVCNVFVWLQVMERALWHADNSYRIPHCVARGHLCRTNRPSSTAFRGFGAPQAMFVAETWVTDIADVLRVPPEQVGGLCVGISQVIYLFIYLLTYLFIDLFTFLFFLFFSLFFFIFIYLFIFNSFTVFYFILLFLFYVFYFFNNTHHIFY